jgi:ATP/maltotriose-dependent transcriptional regulator MalT
MRSSNAVAAIVRNAAQSGALDDPMGRAVYDALRRLRDEPRGERLHAIVTRCDLSGEPHKAVAAGLAISRRQFYRELDAGRRRIAEFLEEPSPAGDDDRALGDWKLTAAVSLAAAGHTDAARQLQQDADKDFDASPDSPWLLLGRAQTLHASGQSSDAAALMERCVAQLSVGPPGASGRTNALSLAYTMLTFCYYELGKFREATAAHARNPAATPGSVSTVPRRQYLSVDAMLACDGRSGTARARAISIAFHRFAVEHGFVEDISSSLLLLAGIARFERRYMEAERLARESLTIHQAIGQPVAPISSMLAGIAIDRGDAEAGMRLAHETKLQAAPASHPWWAAHLYEAEASNLIGRPRAALAACARVERDAGNADSRILSWLRRVQARSFELIGETASARQAAEIALEIAGPHGPAYQRLKSLVIAQRLGPQPARRDEIRELAALLGWDKQA